MARRLGKIHQSHVWSLSHFWVSKHIFGSNHRPPVTTCDHLWTKTIQYRANSFYMVTATHMCNLSVYMWHVFLICLCTCVFSCPFAIRTWWAPSQNPKFVQWRSSRLRSQTIFEGFVFFRRPFHICACKFHFCHGIKPKTQIWFGTKKWVIWFIQICNPNWYVSASNSRP